MISQLKRILSTKYFRLVFGILITAVSLYLALRDVSFEEVKTVFVGANFALIGWALISVAVNNVGKAIRWKVLMGPESGNINFTRSFMVILAAQALNTIYPARVGDLSRIYVAGGMGIGRAFVLGTVVVEKLFDMLSYVFLFLILFVLIPLPGWINQSVFSFIIITFAGLGLALLVVYRLDWFSRLLHVLARWLPDGLQSNFQSWIRSGLSSLEVFQRRRDLGKTAFWSLIIWGTAVLTNHLTLRALEIKLPLTAPILVLIVLQISLSLPAVPGRIGIFEYLCILALAVFGISQARALGYGILLHIIALLPQTLLGLLFVGILGMHQPKTNPSNLTHLT